MHKLIILDRDGVINHDSDDYIKSPDEWQPISGSIEAIVRMKQAGYTLGIATNQSGIARGYFTLATLDAMHAKMQSLLQMQGVQIDAIEYCPDHPAHAGPDRKPNTGMVEKLLQRFNACAEETYFVGDSLSDIECALRAGCKPVLVKTGKGEKTLTKLTPSAHIPVFDDLSDFVANLLDK